MPRSSLAPNTQIDQGQYYYTIVETLGEGGFGITYLGMFEDSEDRKMAIKEFFPIEGAIRHTNNDVEAYPMNSALIAAFDANLANFKDEAGLLAKVLAYNHPNIVKYSELVEAYNTAYIVMEYVEGQNLSDYLNCKGVLQEEELKSILCPLLDALKKIHKKDIFHRDIKPANIILRQGKANKEPVLVDFGAAQQGRESHAPVICTPDYAPPELLGTGTTGPFTDIYELGMVCYEALTGGRPSKPRANEELELDWTDTVNVSEEFKKAIEAALKQDHNNRPASVQEWREMMKSPPRVPRTEPSGEPVRSKPRFKPLGYAIIASILFVLMFVYAKGEWDKEMLARDEATFEEEVGRKATWDGIHEGLDDQQIAKNRELTMLLERLIKNTEQKQDEEEKIFEGKVGRKATGNGKFEKRYDLHRTVEWSLPTVTRRLLNEGAKVNVKDDSTGQTPLHMAMMKRLPYMMRVLIVGGADVNVKDNQGRTPLHVAGAFPEMVRVLIVGGADVNAQDNYGQTPLHVAAEYNAAAAKVLLDRKADVNAQDNQGRTPLHVAADYNAAAAKVLLDRKADVNAQDNQGRTPLHQTVFSTAKIARMLLDGGAKVDAQDNYGQTPLHWAAQYGSPDVVEVLLDGGAKVDAKDNHGQTPEDVASSLSIMRNFFSHKHKIETRHLSK